MPVPWFDDKKNNCGQLTNKLATDTLLVNGLVTTYISVLSSNIATLLSGLIIALIF
jgi:ATP-binding cassette subfamily B (MDR/TAP) protein 1